METSKNFDTFLKVVDLVFKLLGIVVTIYLFRLGNQIKHEQERFNIEQKGFDRAITLLKSYVSENASERYLAIKYSELLNQKDSFPDEIIIYVKDLLTKDTVQENIQAANELIQAVNKKAVGRQDTATINLISNQLNEVKPRIYIHIKEESKRSIYNALIDQLENEDFSFPGIQRVTQPYSKTELRYFKKAEKANAEKIAKVLRDKSVPEANLKNLNVSYIGGSEDLTKIRPNHFELWIK